MAPPKLSKLELKIMGALWGFGASSIREVYDRLPARDRPAYTTVQTLIGRLEAKKAVGRVRKIGGANIYDALISREKAQSRLIDDFLALFGGRAQLIMSHFVDEGKLTLDDVQRIERNLRKATKDKKP